MGFSGDIYALPYSFMESWAGATAPHLDFTSPIPQPHLDELLKLARVEQIVREQNLSLRWGPQSWQGWPGSSGRDERAASPRRRG